jgi:hypothetical protein
MNEDDLTFPLNYLGHKFKYHTFGTFYCESCNCTASYYTHIPIGDPNRFCQKITVEFYFYWVKLLSCNENIIKNILE